MHNQSRFTTCQAVAEYTGLTPRGISKMAERGDIKAVKMGGRWLIDKQKVLMLLGVSEAEFDAATNGGADD